MADEVPTNGTMDVTSDAAVVVTTEEALIVPIANQSLILDQAPAGAGFELPFQGSAELELKIKTTTYGLKVETPSADLNVYAVDVTQQPEQAEKPSSIVEVRVAPADKAFRVTVETPQAIPIGPVTIAKVAISVSKGTLPTKKEDPKPQGE